MHFQCCAENEKSGSDKLFVLVMISQYVTDILTQKALNALPELLDTFDILLLHVPGTIGIVRFPRCKRFDLLFRSIVMRNVSDQSL